MTPDQNILNAAADGIEEAIARHTVAVVTRNENGEPLRGNGTGIAARWNGQRVILTAAHVVQDTPTTELRFFARSAQPIVRAEAADLRQMTGAPNQALRGFDPIEIQRGIRCQDPNLDLAFLEVSRADLSEDRLQFFELDRTSEAPGVGETIVTTGHPSDIARQTERTNDWVLFPSTCWTTVADPQEQPGFNAELHFLAPYDGLVDDNVHPKGFSGAGMWYHANNPILWHANLRLAGIVTSFYRPTNMLQQTRIEKVIEFLTDTLGD